VIAGPVKLVPENRVMGSDPRLWGVPASELIGDVTWSPQGTVRLVELMAEACAPYTGEPAQPRPADRLR
jgi:hypothetical protein